MSLVSQHVSCANLPRIHRGYCTYVSDDDECVKTPGICGPHSVCANNLGGYDCECEDGYVDEDGKCVG